MELKNKSMKIPKFVKRIIIKSIGKDIPVAIESGRVDFPRSQFIDFSEKEIDEFALGDTYNRIESLRKQLIEYVDMGYADKRQREVMRGAVNEAVSRFEHKEAMSRTIAGRNDRFDYVPEDKRSGE